MTYLRLLQSALRQTDRGGRLGHLLREHENILFDGLVIITDFGPFETPHDGIVKQLNHCRVEGRARVFVLVIAITKDPLPTVPRDVAELRRQIISQCQHFGIVMAKQWPCWSFFDDIFDLLAFSSALIAMSFALPLHRSSPVGENTIRSPCLGDALELKTNLGMKSSVLRTLSPLNFQTRLREIQSNIAQHSAATWHRQPNGASSTTKSKKSPSIQPHGKNISRASTSANCSGSRMRGRQLRRRRRRRGLESDDRYLSQLLMP